MCLALSLIEGVLDVADKLCIMSVNPGFAGTFIPSSVLKVSEARKIITSRKLSTIIQSDGGISLETRRLLGKAGARAFVVGYPIFSTSDYKEAITRMRKG